MFLAIVDRISTIFALDEYDFSSREYTKVPKDKVEVKLEKASFSWGFRVA